MNWRLRLWLRLAWNFDGDHELSESHLLAFIYAEPVRCRLGWTHLGLTFALDPYFVELYSKAALNVPSQRGAFTWIQAVAIGDEGDLCSRCGRRRWRDRRRRGESQGR